MVRMRADWKMQRRTIHDPQWDDDEVVVIRDFYSDQDRRVVLSSSIEQHTDELGNTVTRATLDRLVAAKRTRAVVSWTLKTEDGQPLPFSESNLLNLPPYVAEFIDSEIDKSWSDLISFPASKEEAEQQEKEEREDEETFRRHLAGSSNGSGPESHMEPDEPQRVGNRSVRRSTSA